MLCAPPTWQRLENINDSYTCKASSSFSLSNIPLSINIRLNCASQVKYGLEASSTPGRSMTPLRYFWVCINKTDACTVGLIRRSFSLKRWRVLSTRTTPCIISVVAAFQCALPLLILTVRLCVWQCKDCIMVQSEADAMGTDGKALGWPVSSSWAAVCRQFALTLLNILAM